jgi:hypothetical protein
MRISIIANDITTYSEIIEPNTSTEETDFSTVLEQAQTDDGNTTPATTDVNAITADGSTSLSAIFQEAADTYGLDVNLLAAVAKTESNFQTDVTSSAGAMGIMQLMPSTAESLGVSDAYDPYDNVMGGAKLLRQLLDQYDGDVTLALAAYNAGTGNVAKYGGVPPFTETRNYIAKIQQLYAQGVTIPDIIYSANGETTSPQDSADAAISAISDALSQASGSGTALSQDDYRQLLSLTNQIIKYKLSQV